MSRVLVVDDDPGVRYTIVNTLQDDGHDVAEAVDGLDGQEKAAAGDFDVVVTDMRMPGMTGMELLSALNGLTDPPAVILVTAHGDERLAVEAMKAGAWDYFRKPFDIDELSAVVARATRYAQLKRKNAELHGELLLTRTTVFRSAAMRRIAKLAAVVARRDVTVLLVGETGTEKEQVAEAIVAASGRAPGPFVRAYCAAFRAETAEADLLATDVGAIPRARGGTLLLDEVGELPAAVQARVLRALRARGADVRVIATSSVDLAEQVAAGAFRKDLYFWLKVVELEIPPLRDRRDDIAPLAVHFMQRYAHQFGVPTPSVDADLGNKLAARPWPGNVEELAHVVEMLVALSDDGAIDPSLLPDHGPIPRTLRERVEAYERGLIRQALRDAGGNRSEAARLLGVGRATLYEKLDKLEIAN